MYYLDGDKLNISIKKFFLYFIIIYFSILSLFKSIFGSKIQYSIILLMIVFTFIYMAKAILNKYKYNRLSYLIILFMFIYYCFLIINGICFNDKSRLIFGVYEYVLYSLPFFIPIFILYDFISIKYVKKIMLMFIFINFFTSLLSLYEYTTGTYLIESKIIAYSDVANNLIRAKVFSSSYLGLSALIGQLSILNLYFIFSREYAIKFKLIFFCSFCINIGGIIATDSRGPLVATGIAIIIFIILYYIFINFRQNNTKKSIGIICIIFSLFIILFCFCYLINYNNGQINNQYLNNIFYRISTIFNWNNDDSNVLRKYFWHHFTDIFKENFLYGIGIGSTGGRIGITSIGPTESAILKRFVELGIIGGIIFYSMIICSFVFILRYLIVNINNFKITIMIITLFASVLVIFIDGITYQICEIQQTMFFHWFIYGLLILIISRQKLEN